VLIDIVVYDGLDELDALGPLEVLRSAGRAGADLTVRLVTRERQDVVAGAYGLRFLPDAVYQPGADVLIVPGGGWVARAEVGAWGEVQRGQWLPLLHSAHQTGGLLAGVCTGTMLLAHAGVIGARRACTHRAAWADLSATGATLVPERVVDDGDLVTSGGVTSGIDLALWLLEREFSPDLADGVAHRMEYRRVRPTTSQSSPRAATAGHQRPRPV
jgi:transcriptional regulator GlxA family with amidase domain